MENKGVLLTYHYREVPQEKRDNLVQKAKVLIQKGGFKVKIVTIVYVPLQYYIKCITILHKMLMGLINGAAVIKSSTLLK